MSAGYWLLGLRVGRGHGSCENLECSARDETLEHIEGADRIGFCVPFTVSASSGPRAAAVAAVGLCMPACGQACGPRSIYSGAKSLAALGCAEYSAAAPSVTSVPLVPPSAATSGVKSRIGESGAAPPVAEQASRLRGIRRSAASGRKSEADSRMGPGRRVPRTCRSAGPTVSKNGTIGGPVRGRESYRRNGGAAPWSGRSGGGVGGPNRKGPPAVSFGPGAARFLFQRKWGAHLPATAQLRSSLLPSR